MFTVTSLLLAAAFSSPDLQDDRRASPGRQSIFTRPEDGDNWIAARAFWYRWDGDANLEDGPGVELVLGFYWTTFKDEERVRVSEGKAKVPNEIWRWGWHGGARYLPTEDEETNDDAELRGLVFGFAGGVTWEGWLSVGVTVTAGTAYLYSDEPGVNDATAQSYAFSFPRVDVDLGRGFHAGVAPEWDLLRTGFDHHGYRTLNNVALALSLTVML